MCMPTSNTDRCWVKQLGEMRAAKGWWHSFELPDGQRIDGVHSVDVLRQRIAPFGIPEDLRGCRVLDIGTWDGWFSFEMERRGSAVVAIDNWDNPRFRRIHATLGSGVDYRQMDMFELTPANVGRFDIVLFLGVLYHLKHPLLALERVCALTTGMAAVESFVLRDAHRADENAERRPLMEFYETDEFGGQTDNWIGPSLPCLLAFCRTAGFARVEARNLTAYGASVACHRSWEPPSSTVDPPRLTRVEHNTRKSVRFDSHGDDYVSAWFHCAETALGLNDVKPEVGGYGVRPIYVAQLEDQSWQANFKLPPGLEPGWHAVAIRLRTGPHSNSQAIAVDVAGEAPPVLVPEPIRIAPIRERPVEYSKPMNVQKVVTEIHARIRKEEIPESASRQDAYELAALRSAYQRLYQNRNAIGKMPPSPNTLRARIGAYLVRGVQRCLFWYTPQILQFQNDVISALNSACALVSRQSERASGLEQEVRRLRRNPADRDDLLNSEPRQIAEQQREQKRRDEILESASQLVGRQSARTDLLERELEKLRREITGLQFDAVRPQENPNTPALPNSFEFALQDRFRGSEAETTQKLETYLELLPSLLADLPTGQWLDVGCGRGEWMEAVSKLGHKVLGIDSNPASVRHCREKGLPAEETDGLAYLRSCPDASTAVVTALHVVEHWSMHDVLALVREASRILQPGGLLIIETPNPANLRMGSTDFWNDPTHRRPIPAKLLEFVFEYFGFTMVKRLELNPYPPAEKFAFDEISVVHRLNEYFYGPQDYGLIGRR